MKQGDLISRDALAEKVTERLALEWGYEGIEEDIAAIFEEAPAVDAVPVVHGLWVGTADGYADGELVYDMWECSECGYYADGADEKPNWNYCPNCGAKMDGERKDNE